MLIDEIISDRLFRETSRRIPVSLVERKNVEELAEVMIQNQDNFERYLSDKEMSEQKMKFFTQLFQGDLFTKKMNIKILKVY